MASLVGDISHPEMGVQGRPSRVQIAEVVAINADTGTIDARPITSRAVQHGVPYPTWWVPRMGERCLLAQDGGDLQRPVCLGYFAPADGSLGSPQAQFTVAPATLPKASATGLGIVELSAAPADPATPIAVSDQDARLPTAGEALALLGTSGAPGNANKYVTDSDTRNTNARTPSGAAGGDLTGTFPNPTLRAALLSLINNAIQSASNAGGDLTGQYPNPTLAAALRNLINGAIQAGAAAGGDLTGTYPSPTIAAALRTLITTALQPGTAVGGDLTGTLPNPTVADRAVKNTQISSTQGQLTFDAGGLGLTFPAGGGGLTFAGTSAAGMLLESDGAGGAYWGPGIPASLPPSGAAAGDLNGTYPNPGVRYGTSLDTRNAATSPADYTFRIVFLQFKATSAIGLSTLSTSAWASLVGFRAWSSDDTGGRAHEIAYADDGIWYRNGTTSGGWGAWNKIRTDADAASVVNLMGPFASRPATSPKGTRYLCTDLIFAGGGGGLTFPSSGGLSFGPADGQEYLSDGSGWTLVVAAAHPHGAPPRARIYRSAALSPTNATWQKIPLDAIEGNLDNDGMFDSANGRLVCNTAGTYLLTGMVVYTSSGTGANRLAGILVNGVPKGEAHGPIGVYTRINVSTGPVDLAAGDTIELWTYQDSGAALALYLTDPPNGLPGNINWLSAVRIDRGY